MALDRQSGFKTSSGDRLAIDGPTDIGLATSWQDISRKIFALRQNQSGREVLGKIIGHASQNQRGDRYKEKIPGILELPDLRIDDLTVTSNRTADAVAATLKQKPHGDSIDKLKVKRDMIPPVRDGICFARTHDPGDRHYRGYLLAQTSLPPGDQDYYSATVTRRYEEQAMKVLVQRSAENKNLSQKELVSIVSSLTPDQETAVLTLANLTKNLAALTRGANDRTASDGVKFLKHRDYTASDAVKVAKMLQPVNSGSDKMGCMYHFYGALAATYFLGQAGKKMVELESRTHNDPQKAAANLEHAVTTVPWVRRAFHLRFKR